MKRFSMSARHYFKAHWRTLGLLVLAGLVVSGLLLFRLGSLTGGLHPSEVRQAEFASSWRHIIDNPLQLPFTTVQWLILTIVPHHGSTITRAASPIFGVLALAAFAYTLRRWYGVRSAVFGSVIFGLSSWFLHTSRFAGFDVVYLWAVPMLLATVIAWDRHHTRRVASYLALAMLGLLLYIPGMQWLIVAVLLLQPHLLVQSWRTTKTVLGRSALVVIPLLVVTPLIVAGVRTPALAQTWLGVPTEFGTPSSVGRDLLHSVSFFIFRGPATPELWLARSPILSFFGTVMVILGTLFYAKHFRAPRTRLLLAFFVIGALLFSLGGPVTISVLVPLVYLLIAAGFGYLLHEWLRVFPRNPLARNVGFTLLAIVVALSCAYNVKAYYVAWPHNPDTRAAFQQRP